MRHDDLDSNKSYFRSSERIFKMNECWYFSAREGDQGPFDCEREARQEATRFIHEKLALNDFQRARDEANQSRSKEEAVLEQFALDQRRRLRQAPPRAANRTVTI